MTILFLSFIADILEERKEARSEWKNIHWKGFYDFAQKQAIIGFVFEGIKKYGDELKDIFPKEVLFQWIGDAKYIKQQNRIAFKRSAEISEFFAKKGLCTCILKGQGNALMYENPYCRTSGDIDIWIDGLMILFEVIVRQYLSNHITLIFLYLMI